MLLSAPVFGQATSSEPAGRYLVDDATEAEGDLNRGFSAVGSRPIQSVGGLKAVEDVAEEPATLLVSQRVGGFVQAVEVARFKLGEGTSHDFATLCDSLRKLPRAVQCASTGRTGPTLNLNE